MSKFLFDCAIAHKAIQGTLLNPLASISGLKLWVKAGSLNYKNADRTNPAVTDNDIVRSLINKADKSYLSATSETNPITLKTVNRKISFDCKVEGNSFDFDVVGSAGYVNSTMALIFRVNEFYKDYALFDTSGNNGIGLAFEGKTGKLFLAQLLVAVIGKSNKGINWGAYNLVVATYDGSGNWKIRLNKQLDSSGTNLKNPTRTTKRRLFASANNASPFFGNVIEAIEFNRVLTDSEIDTLETYMYNQIADNTVYKYAAIGYSVIVKGKMFVAKSVDGKNWNYLPTDYPYNFLGGLGGCVGIIYKDGWYWMSNTRAQYVQDYTTEIVVSKSQDLVNWQTVTTVNLATAGNGILRIGDAALFLDGDTLRIIANYTNNPDWTGWKVCETHSLNAENTLWSEAVVITTSGLPANFIDPYMIKVNGEYVLVCKNENTTKLFLAKSSNLLSGYTFFKDLSALSPIAEGPCFVKIPNGWRLYFDEFVNSNIAYCDTFDNFETWTAKQSCAMSPYMSHPTIVELGVNTVHVS